MAAICEQELLNIYNLLEPKLIINGFEPELALIRDYLLKILIVENEKTLGKLIVDYSPKKQSYNFRKDSDLPEEDFTRILKLIGEKQPEKRKEKKVKPVCSAYEEPFSGIDVSGIKFHAYVDGSFIEGCVGYGAVILEDGNVKKEISGCLNDDEAISSRQVGGEIQAVIQVLEWCKQNNINEIAIFYDFQNIEKWAVGAYKTNTPMTQEYKKYIDECGISITWVKVESHTGVELNDRADVLAKNGAKMQGNNNP